MHLSELPIFVLVALFTGHPAQSPRETPETAQPGIQPGVQLPPRLSVSNMIGVYGASVPLKATLKRRDSEQPIVGAKISFTVDGEPVGAALTGPDGEARVQLAVETTWAVGPHAIQAVFSGDGAKTPGASGSATLNVLKTATGISGGAGGGGLADYIVENGGDFKFSGRLYRVSDNKGLVGRAVEIANNGVVFKTAATDADGRFSIDVDLPKSASSLSFTLDAEFAGDSHYTGAAMAPQKISEKAPILGTVYLFTAASSPLGEFRVGTPLLAVCTAKQENSSMDWIDPQPGIKVQVRLQDTLMGGGKTDDDGRVSILYTPQQAGMFWVNCRLDTDVWKDGTVSATGQTPIKIKPGLTTLDATGPASAKSGQTFTVSATLKRFDGKPLAGRKVEVGGSSGLTDPQGHVTFKAKAEGSFGIGTVKVPVRFAGDSDWDKSEDPITVKITPADN